MTDIVVNTVAKKQRANTFTPPQKKTTTNNNKKQKNNTNKPKHPTALSELIRHGKTSCLWLWSIQSAQNTKEIKNCTESPTGTPGKKTCLTKTSLTKDYPDYSPPQWKDHQDETALIKVHCDERPPRWDCLDQNPLWWKTYWMRLPWSKSTETKDHQAEIALIKIHCDERPPRWDCPDQSRLWWKTTQITLPWSKSTTMKNHLDETALMKDHPGNHTDKILLWWKSALDKSYIDEIPP